MFMARARISERVCESSRTLLIALAHAGSPPHKAAVAAAAAAAAAASAAADDEISTFLNASHSPTASGERS